MSGYRRAPHPRADHEAAAQMARRTPGEWVLATTYPAAGTARDIASQVQTGRISAYGDGVWQARTRPAADGTTALYVRYTGRASELSSRLPELSFSTDPTGLEAVLRVDDIRRATLIGLVAEWGEEGGQEYTLAALDELAEAVTSHDSTSDEIAALADAVEDTTGMGYAQVRLNVADLERLRRELDAAFKVLTRVSPSRDDGGDAEVTALVYRQRDGRDAA